MRGLIELKSVARRSDRSRRVEQSPAAVALDRWERRFADLVTFKTAHGHCNVPSSYQEDRSLAIWVFNCRRQRKEGTLSAERIKRLDSIGFVWSVRKRRFAVRDWDAMVEQLAAFHQQNGHSSVPFGSPRHRELAMWLHSARCNKRSGRLDADRVRQLDALDVVWEPQQARWEKMFAALVDYRRRHGDCNVPYGWPENTALATWVKGMRVAQKRGELDAERIHRLEAIGFGWDRGGDCRWDEMYDELADFAQLYGHCRISTLSAEHRALGIWIHTQRTLRKQGRLESKRIARLDAIGFTWDPLREQWDAMFAALVDYQRANGHCDVPQVRTGDRRLGNWVMTQRAAYKAGRLDGEQIAQLRAVGFRFSLAGDRLTATPPQKSRVAPLPERRRAA